MVRLVRVPHFSRSIFTANELCGWADGIQYTPSQVKERKLAKRIHRIREEEPREEKPAVAVHAGREL